MQRLVSGIDSHFHGISGVLPSSASTSEFQSRLNILNSAVFFFYRGLQFCILVTFYISASVRFTSSIFAGQVWDFSIFYGSSVRFRYTTQPLVGHRFVFIPYHMDWLRKGLFRVLFQADRGLQPLCDFFFFLLGFSFFCFQLWVKDKRDMQRCTRFRLGPISNSICFSIPVILGIFSFLTLFFVTDSSTLLFWDIRGHEM